jgi:hypothetical protein
MTIPVARRLRRLQRETLRRDTAEDRRKAKSRYGSEIQAVLNAFTEAAFEATGLHARPETTAEVQRRWRQDPAVGERMRSAMHGITRVYAQHLTGSTSKSALGWIKLVQEWHRAACGREDATA